MHNDEMKVSFPGNLKVGIEYRGLSILTDQPTRAGGDGSAPAPFDLFLASIAACAGYYALVFCKKRGIPMDGIQVIQQMEQDPEAHRIGKITIEVRVPPSFPEKYLDALVHSMNQCTVKRHITEAPQFEVKAKVVP